MKKSEWKPYWVGEDTEVYLARSEEEAVTYVQSLTGEIEEEHGPVENLNLSIYKSAAGYTLESEINEVIPSIDKPTQIWTHYT